MSKISATTMIILALTFLFINLNSIVISFEADLSTNTNLSVTSQQNVNLTYGGISDDKAYSIISTSDGGYLLAGYTESYGNGISDMWLVKTDTNGQAEWNRTFGGKEYDMAFSVVATLDGGYALAGFTESYGAGESDMLLVKTDVNGDLEWNKTYGGTGNDGAFSIITTSDGGYALAGITKDPSGSLYRCDLWLVKTDSVGNMEWNQTFGRIGFNDTAHHMVTTSDGGYALVGYTLSPGPFGGTDDNMLLIKINSTGYIEWNNTHKMGSNEAGYSVVATNDGGYALVGESTTSDGYYDMWLEKTDSNGLNEWNHVFGGTNYEVAYSIIVTTDGGYALAGYTESYGNGSSDMWLVKTDADGHEEWNQTFGGVLSERAESIIQTSNGNFVLAGYTESYGNGNFDMFLVFFNLQNVTNIFNPSNSETSSFNISIDSTFILLLITCSLVCIGLLLTRSIRKKQLTNALMKSTSTSDIQFDTFDSLIKDIELEISDKPTISKPMPLKGETTIIEGFPSGIGSTQPTLADISLSEQLNKISMETLKKQTPLFVILISPLFWFVFQILFPPQIRTLSIDQVRDNPLRQQIIAVLRAREFIHYFALKQFLKCGNARLTWHLQVLEDFGLIKRKKFGRVQVFFLRSSFLDEYKLTIYCSIRSKTALMILKSFLENDNGQWNIALLSQKLHKSQPSIKYHCNKLISLGLLERPNTNNNQYQLVEIKKEYVKWLIERYHLEQFTSSI